MVSSVMAKVYQVEKAKKVERRKIKEGIVSEPVAEPVAEPVVEKVEEPAVEKVADPVIEKVVESGEVKAKPAPKKPASKKKKQTKKKEK